MWMGPTAILPAYGQMSPDEHASHHPGRGQAGQTAAESPTPGSAERRGGGMGEMMGGGMDRMMEEMMRQQGGASGSSGGASEHQ